jgi:hypothetical protein
LSLQSFELRGLVDGRFGNAAVMQSDVEGLYVDAVTPQIPV